MSAVNDTAELHYLVDGTGEGPPLLLSGSLGTTVDMWEPQLPALAPMARLIRFDHRGHGGSPVLPGPYEIADLGRDALALMDALSLERASFCGLSIGGMVGQWLAVNAPERIERLILICSAARVPGGDAFRERAAMVRAAGSPEPVADAVVGRWFTPAFAESQPELVASYRAMIVATAAEGYAGCAEAVAGHDVRLGLRRVAARTLVISGAQDRSLPAELGREIAGAVSGSRFVTLEPAAHLASVERADEVNHLIAEHLSLEAGT
jgi:3-oxoadipate enol-lactonase